VSKEFYTDQEIAELTTVPMQGMWVRKADRWIHPSATGGYDLELLRF